MNLMKMERLVVYVAFLSMSDGCQFGLPEEYCVFQCHCQNRTPCDPVTGACPDGCTDGDPDGYFWRGAWGGPGCQEGNLAYKRPVFGSDRINIEPGRAVDGNTAPTYVYNSGSCTVQQGVTWQSVLWQVDLGNPQVVNNVTVYGTDRTHMDASNHWVDRSVEVGEPGAFERCGSLGDSNQALMVNVICPTPLVGRYVRFKASSDREQYPQLYLCEVYVNGYSFVECTGGTFGPGCLTECHCHTNCDVISGVCSSFCEDGLREFDCQTHCASGTWGSNCSHTCLCMNPSEACHHIDGSCQLSGCAPSHVGVGCDAVIPSLNSAPYNLILISTSRLEFEFRSWQLPQDSGDRPSSYVPQLRLWPDTTWEDMPEIPAGSGTISVLVDYDFDVNAIYDVRVIPLLVHEGVVHRGIGQHATLTPRDSTVSPESSGSSKRTPSDSSGAIAGGVVAVLLVVTLVIHALFLRRYYCKRGVSPGENGAAVIGTVPSTSQSETANDTLTADGDHVYASLAEPTRAIDRSFPTTDLAEDGVVRGTPNLYENRETLERAIKVHELVAYIQDTRRQMNGFENEFKQIPSGQKATWSTAEWTINMGKNRFNNIMAYDHSRVKLDVSTQDQDQGYINANFIPTYGNGGKGYIATQGPRVHTIIDTWQMVWQYQINRIVMLTTIMQEDKAKCEYYWPKTTGSEAQEYGEFKVRFIKAELFADYVVRTLSVTFKEETRTVTQFHYLSWPNHSVPQSAASLLNFRRKVRAQDDTATGPLVVHCSGGVGRTGVFIVLDYTLDQAMNEMEVDVLKNVSLVRSYRINMVENVAQYTFVYEALLHALQCDSTAIPAADMAKIFHDLLIVNPVTNQSPLARQFEFVNDITSQTSDKYDSRPILFPHRDAGSDYINATYINGYRRLSAYIVTQMPLPQTLCDFWRMVYDHKSTSIVLTYDVDPSQPEDETCPQYWPSEVNGVHDLDFLEVELESEEVLTDGITVRQFRITYTTETEEKAHTVRQFHLQGWLDTATTPPNPDQLLTLLDALEQWQRQSGNDVITVQCKNGVHQSGVVCAVSFLLEKLKVDQEIDAFLAVTQIRLGRPQLIDSFEQYVFLHEIALKYMERCDMYANFKRVT